MENHKLTIKNGGETVRFVYKWSGLRTSPFYNLKNAREVLTFWWWSELILSFNWCYSERIITMPSKKRKYNARFPAVSWKMWKNHHNKEKWGFVFVNNFERLVISWHCLFVGANQEDYADWWGSGESGPSCANHNLYPFQIALPNGYFESFYNVCIYIVGTYIY